MVGQQVVGVGLGYFAFIPGAPSDKWHEYFSLEHMKGSLMDVEWIR